MRSRTVLVALLAGVLVAPAHAECPLLDIEVFAPIGPPGQPEGIAVGDDGTVYVGTHTSVASLSTDPSKVFAFSPTGELLREYTIEGQVLDDTHGVLAMAFDGDGFLYVLDRAPARVLRLDPDTGEQSTYATFRDVAPCALGGTPGDCSAGLTDLDVFADYLVFAADGTAYVTDLEQALIWRVPPGGGAAEVWFTDERLEGVFGPNGIQFMADGSTLLFAQTGSHPPGTLDLAQGALYTLPVLPDADVNTADVRVVRLVVMALRMRENALRSSVLFCGNSAVRAEPSSLGGPPAAAILFTSVPALSALEQQKRHDHDRQGEGQRCVSLQ